MDVNLAIVCICAVLLTVVVSIPWGFALSHLGSAGEARLALEHDARQRADALAAHRGELLEEAKRHITGGRSNAEEALERREVMDRALAGAAPGDELDAVERVLRADAERRARRAAAAGAAAALKAAGPGPGGPAGAGGQVGGSPA